MAKPSKKPALIWRLMRLLNQRVAQSNVRRILPDLVLLLTTRGRKTGLLRVTPLQYEEHGGVYYVAAARGSQADWFRNIVHDQNVEVQIKDRKFSATAEPITDPQRIADFLELRIKRHPRMIRAMLLMHGMLGKITRSKLEKLASDLALVTIHSQQGR